MTTHIFISHRALQFVSSDIHEVLIKNLPYLQAGSYFPDWGYACFNKGLASEEAHWPGFWNEALKTQGDEFTAFLFGMVSHGVADASWHSLNTDQGFIQYLKELDFNGNYKEAHDTADFGGEMVLAHSSKLLFLSHIWRWPTKDLTRIYKNIGINVTDFEINTCMIMGYFATIGVSIAGKYLLPFYAQLSPQLVGGYRDYFRGGIMDMVNSVITCWENLGQRLFNGSNSTQFCKFADLDYQNDRIQILSDKKYRNVKPQSWLNSVILVLLELKLNVFFIISNIFKKNTCKNAEKLNSIRIDSDLIYSQLGKAMAAGDFNGDGLKELAISAPYFSSFGNIQAGIVYILKNNLTSGLIHENSDYSLSIKHENVQRFGYALAVVDLNMDGIDDLAVSAPTSQASTLNYLGTVYVFFGSVQGLGSVPNITIRSEIPRKIPHIPGEKWDSQFNILGEKLVGIDLDGDGFKDLIIGSPHTTILPSGFQRGKVSAFYANSRHQGNILVDNADWTLEGSKDYELFGYSLEISHNFSKPMLFIGSPGYHDETHQSHGRIYGFRLNGQEKPVLIFTISSNFAFSQFGKSIAVGDFYGTGEPILAVSSSTEQSTKPDPSFILLPGLLLRPELKGFQAGNVRYINVKSLSGNLSLSFLDEKVIRSVSGTHSFGHLGDLIIPSKDRGALWVTEPMYYRETGRVYKLQSPPSGHEFVGKSPLNCYSGSSSLQRFGNTILVDDINNDGMEDLVITTLSGKEDESGSVYIFLHSI